MKRTNFALLALLLTACTGSPDAVTDPGHDIDTPDDADTDSDADGLVPDVMIASTINYASWNDDMTEVVDNIQDVEGVGYTGSDGETGTTIGFEDLAPGEHTVNYTFTDGSASYLGTATKTVDLGDEDPTIETALCIDLTGDWTCQNEYEGELYEPFDTHIEVMSDCTVDAEHDSDVELNGHHWTSEDLDGIASEDGTMLTLNHFGDNGDWYGIDTCTKH
jgi:hypothetical protein